MKIFAFLIDVMYWLGLFIIPVIVFFVGAFCLYASNTTGLFLSILIAITGVVLGIAIAEYIRKKYGLNNFWSGVSTNLQIDKDNVIKKDPS